MRAPVILCADVLPFKNATPCRGSESGMRRVSYSLPIVTTNPLCREYPNICMSGVGSRVVSAPSAVFKSDPRPFRHALAAQEREASCRRRHSQLQVSHNMHSYSRLVGDNGTQTYAAQEWTD
jgi:hypothetical protein